MICLGMVSLTPSNVRRIRCFRRHLTHFPHTNKKKYHGHHAHSCARGPFCAGGRVSGRYRSFCFVFRQTERIKRRAHCHFARRPLSMALVRTDNYVNTHQTIMFGIGARCDDRDGDGKAVIAGIDFFVSSYKRVDKFVISVLFAFSTNQI